ncbi:MAG: glycosyltransferase [Ruminococcaceae bacterium]|nr:glycosyltransferase [Oscillospiraceae bacterium]
MKVFYINGVSYGSTGRIMFQLADKVKECGGDALCTAGFTWNKCEREDFFQTSGLFEKKLHTELSKITGKHGGYSLISTKKLISKINVFDPDVIHLHNIHGWFLNFEMLFDYLKKSNKKIVWTLHDCWSFTGYCPHFDMLGCEKWKTGCFECPYNGYPKTYFDCSEKQYKRKKELFSGIHGLSIVTPSLWLKSKVEDSFLKDYPIHVINNGIDLSVFKPCSDKSVLDKYGITTKYSVLGVSYGWDNKKGLDAFISLSETLGDKYTVVLVGTDESIEKNLPKNIVAIRRTQNQKELALLYSVADVFVNPTLEDTFPTVNMEALACGTPIAAYKTGGSVEIPDNNCGFMVEKRDILGLEKAIRKICEEKPFSKDNCKIRAKSFDKELFENKYMDLYRSMI